MSGPRAPIRINLIEQPGWGKWDLAGEAGDRASDLAWELFTGLISEGECDSLIMDLAGPLKERRRRKQDWTGRVVTWDDAALICNALKDGVPELEYTRDTLLSVFRDAYEDALTPSDRDIRDAVDTAIEKMADNYDLDEDFWTPLIDQGAEPEEIVRGLFEETKDGVFVDRQVTYERKPGHHERYLVFDFWKSDAVKSFLRTLPDDYDMKATLKALADEFQGFVAGFLSRFFVSLDKDMAESDVENRVEWRRHWRDLISDATAPGGAHEVGHELTLDGVRKELVQYLKKARESAGDAEA